MVVKHIILALVLTMVSASAFSESVVDNDTQDQIGKQDNVTSAVDKFDVTFKQDDPVTTKYFLWVIFVFIIGIFISIASVYILKIYLSKKNFIANGKNINILATRRLSTKLSIFLIEIDDKEYLISSSNEANSIVCHRSRDD